MTTPLTRVQFEQILTGHAALIRLANELESQLYRVGSTPTPDNIGEWQQAAGALIRELRTVLFRYDQQVLPQLEALVPPEAAGSTAQPLTPCPASAPK